MMSEPDTPQSRLTGNPAAARMCSAPVRSTNSVWARSRKRVTLNRRVCVHLNG